MKTVVALSLLMLSLVSGGALACTDQGQDPLLCETYEILFASGEASVIRERAESLGSAVAIYEYLRNNSNYAVYHGARSSSLNTFLGMEGNDVDLASTLIAMYRSVGIKSRYVVGDIRLKRSDVANWIGVSNEDLSVSILQNQGINIVDDSDADYVVLEHVWVEALINFASYRGAGEIVEPCEQENDECRWIALDPSFKLKRYDGQYRKILESLSFDYDAYYHAELDQSLRDKSPLEIFEEDALEYLRVNHPGVTLEDVIDSGEIIQENLGLLPSSLPFEVIGEVQRYASIAGHDLDEATDYAWNKKIQVNIYPIIGGVECQSIDMGGTFSAAELSTKQLTVNWGLVDGRTQFAIRLDGEKRGSSIEGNFTIICNGYEEQITATSRFNVVLQIDASPFVDPIQVRYDNLIVGGYYLIATGGETSNWSQVRRAYEKLLSANKTYPLLNNASGEVYVDENDNGSIDDVDTRLLDNQEAQDALTGGLLYTAQALYYTRLKEESRRYSRLKNIISPIAAFAGIVSTTFEVELVGETPFAVLPGGLLIDLKGIRLNGSWVADEPETYSNETFKFLGHIASSLEHEVWQELTGYDAVSTMRGIQFALRDGAALLDVHNNAEGNTYLAALNSFGFSQELPPGFVEEEYTIFGRRLASFDYTGSSNAASHELEILRGDLTGLSVDDIQSSLVLYSENTDTNLSFFSEAEEDLTALAQTEDDLLTSQPINVSGIGNFPVVSARVTSPSSGFSVDFAPTNDPDVWRFNISETADHPDGGTIPVQVLYEVNDGLDAFNFDVSGFSSMTNNGYDVVSSYINSPTGFRVASHTRISNDVWRFRIEETDYHSGPLAVNLGYRLDNGLDQWRYTLSGLAGGQVTVNGHLN